MLYLGVSPLCFSQTFDEIISINSQEQFIKVATENGFSSLNDDKRDLIIMQKINDYSKYTTASFMTQPSANSNFGLKIDYPKRIRDTIGGQKRFHASLDFRSLRDYVTKNCTMRKKKPIHNIREGQKNPYEKIEYENVSDLRNYKKVVDFYFCYECPGLNGWIGISYSTEYKTSAMVLFN